MFSKKRTPTWEELRDMVKNANDKSEKSEKGMTWQGKPLRPKAKAKPILQTKGDANNKTLGRQRL